MTEGQKYYIKEHIFIALGAASVCWKESPASEFDSERAVEIGNSLYEVIMNELGDSE